MADTITKEDAVSLAVRYQSYCEAMDADRPSGIIAWGDMLLRTQRRLGVEIMDNDMLEEHIASSQKKMDEDKRE